MANALESHLLLNVVVVLISGVVVEPEEVTSKRHLSEAIVRDPEEAINGMIAIVLHC